MGMIGGNGQEKSQLAREICELSARARACAKLHHPRTNKSTFVDWYLVLKVDENADTCIIRRQYHKLALQLHPDKNSNSKAETAFKLVSEAYYCLSDTTRRRAFETERNTISCIKCKTNSPTTKRSQPTSRYSRIKTGLRELSNKLNQEAAIIEKCLLANAASRRQLFNGKTRKESPLFDPSDYQHKSYPRHIHRAANYSRVEDLRAAVKLGNRRKDVDYPIFQYRSERASSLSKCPTMRERERER